jgi:uncharacterized protein (TIGR03437 family)
MKQIATAALRRFSQAVLAATLCAALFPHPGRAQAQQTSVLRIDTGNVVFFNQDTTDVSKYATDPNVTTPVSPKNFQRGITIADIQAVNNQPAMGVLTRSGIGLLNLRTAPAPGQAIADTVRNAALALGFEIMKSDGTPIGTIMAFGFNGGASPPGAPANVNGGNFAVTGGTGAFFGARGQVVAEDVPPGVPGQRGASITEDPANRRRHGGGRQRWIIQLIPMFAPQIIMAPGGPAVTHSHDFSSVTAAKPAAAGEILSLFATGLGPVTPAVEPGQPFPSSPLATVNSPVEVLVNGKAAEVLSAVGFPGSVDGYQVNFRVPADAGARPATVQIIAAWISGPPVTIPAH